MALKNRADLIEKLYAAVHINGVNGKTKAKDVRDFLELLVDEIINRSGSANTSVLEFVFEAGFADSMVRTIGIRQAGIYNTHGLSNIAKVTYKINNGAVKDQPQFTIVTGDKLELSITRLITNQGATVSLIN